MQTRFVLGLVLMSSCSVWGQYTGGSFYQPRLPQIFGVIEFKQNNGLLQIEVIDDRYVLVDSKTITLQIPTWKLQGMDTVDIWLNTARILKDRDQSKQNVKFVSRDPFNDLLIG
ncbi:hypothetical protein FBUS_04681 [Fasciolopsis buskii]|uniref:Uncharacterized protein n=1 Tax=Fasciolopsis buskii TaxID=27845 RepID=A0A8E0RZR1_9TREM|nr:hypothetical protein FBUS_04681 [Fasciolopsis buski]